MLITVRENGEFASEDQHESMEAARAAVERGLDDVSAHSYEPGTVVDVELIAETASVRFSHTIPARDSELSVHEIIKTSVTPTDHPAVIRACQSLDELLTALMDAEEDCAIARKVDEAAGRYGQAGEGIEQRYGIDLAELPTFGGAELDPEDTHGIFSWDETRLLVADGSRWSLVARAGRCDDGPDRTDPGYATEIRAE